MILDVRLSVGLLEILQDERTVYETVCVCVCEVHVAERYNSLLKLQTGFCYHNNVDVNEV